MKIFFALCAIPLTIVSSLQTTAANLLSKRPVMVEFAAGDACMDPP